MKTTLKWSVFNMPNNMNFMKMHWSIMYNPPTAELWRSVQKYLISGFDITQVWTYQYDM